MDKIKVIEGFEFKEGQTAFNDLVEFVNKEENKKTIESAYKKFMNYKGSISEWITNNNGEKDIINLLDQINKFVSYCDVNALSTDSEGKPFQNPEKKIYCKSICSSTLLGEEYITISKRRQS